MPVAKNKTRITISIHKESKEMLDELISLHNDQYSYSNLVEIAIMAYGYMVLSQIDKEDNKGENN